MTLMKMPVFTWMILVVQVLLVFALPVITVALVLLTFDRLFGANFFNVSPGRRPAAVAAPVLDLRPPRGLHPDPAGLRHRVRGHPGLQPQADLRLPVHGRLGHRHRLHGLGRVGPPHVRLGHRARSRWPAFSLSTMFIAVPTGVKILNWMATMYGGRARVHDRHAVLHRPGGHVHHRRPVGRDPRRRPGRHPADRHLLHRRPLPLRALRRGDDGPLLGHLLLVAEDLRPLPQREAGQVSLLADAHRLQPDLRADAHPGPAGHEPPDLHLRGGPRLRRLEPGVHASAPSSSPCPSWSSWSTWSAAGSGRADAPGLRVRTRGTPGASSG